MPDTGARCSSLEMAFGLLGYYFDFLQVVLSFDNGSQRTSGLLTTFPMYNL